MTTYSALSIYGLADQMDDKAVDAWLAFHKRLAYPSRFINVFTAARYNDAPNLLRRVRASLPQTTPVWRGYDGRDAWGNLPTNGVKWDDSAFYLNLWNHSAMTPKMAAGLWFNGRVKPHLALIREVGAIVHLLNEASPLFNAEYETECIRILGEEGVRAGAFAWAAGTPADWNDYQAQPILDEVAMAAKYDALVMCHEYSGIKPEEQNSLINRNQTLVKLFPKAPDVFLGEFGLAKATIVKVAGVDKILLDPDRGWREMGVSELQYFDFISSTSNMWYLSKGVAFSLYAGEDWGLNGSFGVMKAGGLLDELVEASEWMVIKVQEPVSIPPAPDKPVTIERPAEAKIGIRVRVKSIPTEYRNLRESWDYRSKKLGELKPGDIVRRFDIPLHSGYVAENSMGNWIYVEKLDGDTPDAKVMAAGYVWSTRITWENLNTVTGEVPVVVPPPQSSPVVTGEEAEPTPEPDPVPSVSSKRYSIEITATDERHALIEKTLMALLTSVVYLGQVMSGVSVTINSEAVR